MSLRPRRADAVVIGGGAAGMLCSALAAERGLDVILLEPNAALGKKLRISGKGRCNVTNDCPAAEFIQSLPGDGRFMQSAIHRFGTGDTMALFERLGVPLKVERGRRVFPQSDRAEDIVRALERYMLAGGVDVLHERAEAILTGGDGVRAVRTAEGDIECRSAVICTGGLSYPGTGSTGDGYRLAAALGHTVTPTRPSLVPLESPEAFCGRMQGLALKNVMLTVKNQKGKAVFREQGELLFTHFGLSGPLVLSASAHMRDFAKDRYRCHIDLKPALDEATLDARLVRELTQGANRDMDNLMGALLPRLMIPVVLERAGIPGEKKAHDLTRGERRRLLEQLKDFALDISGPRPVAEAIVTSGGVKVGEVDPRTMASKKVRGLFFAGELLDVDAYTGGFNLQIAWATGRAAGEGAARFLREAQ